MPPLTHVIAGCLLNARDQLLVIRQRNRNYFTLPGGPPEHGETPMATLARHWRNALGSELTEESLALLGRFRTPMAETSNQMVDADVFVVTQLDVPIYPTEDILWLPLSEADAYPLAPLLQQEVLPALRHWL